MKELSSIKIDHTMAEKIQACSKRACFQNSSTIFYKGHRLPACFFIQSGQIVLKNKKKVRQVIASDTLVGFEEFLIKGKIGYDIVSDPGLEIFFIDKELLLDLVAS